MNPPPCSTDDLEALARWSPSSVAEFPLRACGVIHILIEELAELRKGADDPEPLTDGTSSAADL